MNLTLAAIEKNRITVVVLAVILLSGALSFFDMERAEDPGFVIRVAAVVTYFPGASPRRVEQLVTDKIEKAIQQMPELKFVSSESKNGISIVYVNIRGEYREMRPIWDSLRRKVTDVSPQLPDGVIGPFVNDEFGDVFGTVIGITGDGFDYAELKEVADEVRDELLLISDVAKVDVYGDQQERIFVEYNNARLSELGLSPVQLQHA
jgi:multidrug efflux pump subunit AcrB